MESVLTTRALTKQYKQFKALDNLTMTVPRGAIYALVGKNGAGKTTLIRVVCGLQNPTGGTYALFGAEYADRAAARARRRMGAVVETPAIYLDMSAEDNLRAQYRTLGLPAFEGTDEILSLVGLRGTGSKKARHFSLGMRQRLGIAVALCGDPDFLLLDEPVNGLDPQGIIETRELILRLNRERQITFLISSHILDELAKLATHYGFMDEGRMKREMTAAELEAACRKCARLTVSDTGALARALDGMGLEYQIRSDREADVFGEVGVSRLVRALDAAGCELIALREHDERLESFYMNLVGGARRA